MVADSFRFLADQPTTLVSGLLSLSLMLVSKAPHLLQTLATEKLGNRQLKLTNTEKQFGVDSMST